MIRLAIEQLANLYHSFDMPRVTNRHRPEPARQPALSLAAVTTRHMGHARLP